MAGEGKGCAHPARVDRCSLMQGEADYYGGIGLEVAPNAGDEYDSLILSR